MKTTNSLALALALALGTTAAGCSAADPSMAGDDDGTGGTGGDNQKKPLDATGTYAMHSTFDLATNMPGTAGEVVNTIIDATDDSNDPTLWILQQMISALPDGSAVKGALTAGAGVAASFLQTKLLEIAPDFVSTMVQVGHDFGTIAKNFGLNETLELTRSGTGYMAVHTVTGVHFKLDNQDIDFALTNYHVSNIVVNNVAVTMDPTGQLTIAAHNVPLAYGQILRLGLDAAIIPMIDSSAHSLNDLLAHKVNCQTVGQDIYDALTSNVPYYCPVSASVLASICTAGLTAGANALYSQISKIDGTALQFGLSGTAKGFDKNNDRTIDTIATGTWTGTLSYGATPSALAPSTFYGERM